MDLEAVAAEMNYVSDQIVNAGLVHVLGGYEPDGVSKTLGIHRAILRRTGSCAVVHAHPYYATQAVELSARLVINSNNLRRTLGDPALPDYTSPTTLPGRRPLGPVAVLRK